MQNLQERLAACEPGPGGRRIAFLAGAPGAGKSTLARSWAETTGLAVLPMDGFHLSNAELDARRVQVDGVEWPLRRFKGRLETFSLARLDAALSALSAGENMTWPIYDRTLHDPVADGIRVQGPGVFLVEGLWMLLDRPGWSDLQEMAQLAVFLDVAEEIAEARVVARHRRGGRGLADARAHFDRVDRPNGRLIRENIVRADVRLESLADFSIIERS